MQCGDRTPNLRKVDNLIPGQVGRRRCVGEDFGKTMLFAFVVRLVKAFKVELTAKVSLASSIDFLQLNFKDR